MEENFENILQNFKNFDELDDKIMERMNAKGLYSYLNIYQDFFDKYDNSKLPIEQSKEVKDIIKQILE